MEVPLYFPSKCGLLLKERICSYGSKFFPFRVDPHREGVSNKEND